MRSSIILVALGVAATSAACGGSGESDEQVHVVRDKDFDGFEENWRQFISASPDLALTVVRPGTVDPAAWEPHVSPDCVFSERAGGKVVEVALQWNEPLVGDPNDPAQSSAPELRFDLALDYDGLARNLYTSVLSSTPLTRFMIPSNSAYVNDEAAVLRVGPGLFPELMSYRTELVVDPDTQRTLRSFRLVLRDLNGGSSYTFAAGARSGEVWEEARRTVFLSPVCPSTF